MIYINLLSDTCEPAISLAQPGEPLLTRLSESWLFHISVAQLCVLLNNT